jgi:hypothetical protein
VASLCFFLSRLPPFFFDAFGFPTAPRTTCTYS